MPFTLNAQAPHWQGLGLALTKERSQSTVTTLAGELAAMLLRLGGRAPVGVLLMKVEDTLSYVGGTGEFLLDAVTEQPELFEWYSLSSGTP